MKVILKEDVKGLGQKDEMVNVKEGYAKNFLLQKGLAVAATKSTVNEMEQKNIANKSKKDKELLEAKNLKDKLKELEVIIKAKAGENGKLFGSITSKDIADKLNETHSIKIDKKKILLDDAIKTIGTYTVDMKIYPKVVAKLVVKIEKE